MFVGGVTLGPAHYRRGRRSSPGHDGYRCDCRDCSYADYLAFSERLREAHFTEDTGLTSRWHNGALTLDVLANSEANVPARLDVHLIQDSYGTHTMQL